jgi:paraquat-inducible protein B
MKGTSFKLGLFVVVAFGLLLGSLLSLGVLERFRASYTTETFFSESIQNLVPNAPVRFNGMTIGRVSRINLASLEYPGRASQDSLELRRSIMVELKIGAGLVKRLDRGSFDDLMEYSIGRGMRARLATSGLGGPTFVELVYVDPNEFPTTEHPWEPGKAFIPTAPSTVSVIVDSLQTILARLATPENLEGLERFIHAGGEIDEILSSLDGDTGLADIAGSLSRLAEVGAALEAELDSADLADAMDDARAVLGSARSLLEDRGEGGLRSLIADLGTMADRLERAAVGLDGLAREAEQARLIEELRDLATELGPAGRSLDDMAERLDRLIIDNQAGVRDLVETLRRASAQLDALMQEAQQNPSRILFGDPPPRGTPGGTP